MYLYKYLHPDRISILRDGMIRFSSPRVLNDPFELKPHVSALATQDYLDAEIDRVLPKVLAEEYSKLPLHFRKRVSLKQFQAFAKSEFPTMKSKTKGLANMAGPTLQGLMAQKFEEMIGLLCLTESSENLLMWAHYADSHQGFVMGFDTDVAFFNRQKGPEDEFRHLRKVNYSELRPRLVLSEADSFSPFLTKSLDWSYEMEWRMMLPLSEANKIIGEGPTAVHLFEYPLEAIRSVIFGCRMTAITKHSILELIRVTEELQKVKCYQASVHDEHYHLNVTQIN